jgi:hypothetical protein
MFTRLSRFLPWLLLLLSIGAAFAYGGQERLNVLTAHGEKEIVVMDFSRPFPLSPPPPGWYHRRFWTRAPMRMEFAVKEDVPALRLTTRSSASMLFRHTDIPVADYPLLTWRWYVEEPIISALDERTRAGDDHPARLFLAFRTAEGERRNMEIIWGNQLRAGDYKFIDGFAHYVADGGIENVGKWRTVELDLRPIYRRIWSDGAVAARLVEIAIFCDSDETRTQSVAYFAGVRVKRTPDKAAAIW